MNIGGLTNLGYDECFLKQDNKQQTGPFAYQMFYGKHEHDKKCRENKFLRPFDLVDEESELQNRTRAVSKCSNKKYNPKCKKSPCNCNGICRCASNCTSTCDMPVVLVPEVCPIISSGIKKPSGYTYYIPKDTCHCAEYCAE